MTVEPAASTRVAVVLTCHNRRDTTLRCLESLTAQAYPAGVELSVFLTDDGSTDGTADAVAERFPHAKVERGDGTLFWAGGMRRAMASAMAEGFDHYLWVNDDCVLDADAVARLLACSADLAARSGRDHIIVGSLRDPMTGACTYGGALRASSWHRLRFRRVAPSDTPMECDAFNGNLVLISRRVAGSVGNLHPRLVHRTADYEYALRARRLGWQCWIAPGYFGDCPRNEVAGTAADPTLTLAGRFRRLIGPKEYPLKARAAYMSTYGGLLWPILFASVYVALPFRHIMDRFRALKRS